MFLVLLLLFSFFFFSFLSVLLLCSDFVFLHSARYGRPVCCRKKAGLPLSVLLLSPSPYSCTVERRTNERTNDQRNVNRKPREATLINPTEINCAVRRCSPAFPCSFALALFFSFRSSSLSASRALYRARLARLPQKESRTEFVRSPPIRSFRRVESRTEEFSATRFSPCALRAVEKNSRGGIPGDPPVHSTRTGIKRT